MFGQKSLFNDFSEFGGPFSSMPPRDDSSEDARKRNFLLPERNELLAHRFYYYDHIKGLKSERCLPELAKEFFLSERRLIDVIYSINDSINDLRQRRPTLKDLQHKFPWMNWSA